MEVYKDARFAFIVILALMVLVVIIWGRSPNPEDVVREESEPQAVAKQVTPAPSPSAEESSAPAAPSTTDASSADTSSERSEPETTLPPADSTSPPPAAAKAPRDIEGEDERPGFDWAEPSRSEREDTATMIHDGEAPSEPPSVPIEETDESRSDSQPSAETPASPKPARTASTPNTLATHTVAKGDNYQKLARKYYDDVSKWKAIYKANGVEPEKLVIGKKLRIPALDTSEDYSVYRRVTTTTRETSTTTRTTEPASSSAKPYTVKKGDNFYRIALEVYDDASQWKKLYQHNRSQLPDPDDPSSLQAGTRIEIPKLAAND